MDQVEARVSGCVTASPEPLGLYIEAQDGTYTEVLRHIGANLFEVADYNAEGHRQRRRICAADELVGKTVTHDSPLLRKRG